MYTKNAMKARRKTAREKSAWGEGGRREEVAPLFDDRACLLRLQAAGGVHSMPTACPACDRKGSMVGPMPRPGKNSGMLYYRCHGACERCGAWHNVLKFSKLPLTKMTVGQTHFVLHGFCDLTKQTGKLVAAVRAAIAAASVKESSRIRLGGDLEADERGLRLAHISPNNRNFAQPVVKKKPPYWLLYLRVIGMRRRAGGKMIVKFLGDKLVRPKGGPPPLSEKELIDCRILERAAKGSVIFTDGAKAYGTIIKKHFKGELYSRQVAHNRMQFVRRVTTPSGHSKMAGTQSIDGTWKHLQKHIPQSLHTKKGRKKNPMIETYVNEWLWRHNHREGNGFKMVGALFKD
ncbi:unnamed protein product, partial [Prorocentrum cordatum]